MKQDNIVAENFSNKMEELIHEFETDAKDNWHDWTWQIKNSVDSIEKFEKFSRITFSDTKRQELRQVLKKFPLSVTPYYLSLIDFTEYEQDPVYLQSIPSVQELAIDSCELSDPLHEDEDSPVPGITHRYPDRVLFHVSNTCAMYCRHCTRKRKVGDVDSIPNRATLEKGIEYIKKSPEIRDVLLSGGDPFLLSDEIINWLLAQLSAMDHVEVIRIGTRTPVVLPFRITNRLIDILKRYQPLWINTHFNHPQEFTEESKKALQMLANAGIPLGNQTVLLSGVNDCPRIMKKLNHLLVKNRVRPYYLYQCDLSEGLTHFRTPVGKGIEIIENLRGHTSGFAVPTYVIDAPGGGGKIPVMPNYLLSQNTNKVILRNYEGVIASYKEPDSYKPRFCNHDCQQCDLQLNMHEGAPNRSIGLEKLLSDNDETISLIPQNNERMKRRENG